MNREWRTWAENNDSSPLGALSLANPPADRFARRDEYSSQLVGFLKKCRDRRCSGDLNINCQFEPEGSLVAFLDNSPAQFLWRHV